MNIVFANRRTKLLFLLLTIVGTAALVLGSLMPVPAQADGPNPMTSPSPRADMGSTGGMRAPSSMAYVPALPPAPLNQPPTQDPLPPPPSVGADVPTTYFGPAPSEALIDPRDKALVGPVKLLQAGQVDAAAFTVTLPLYRGQMEDGRNVWYILTDTTDKANADALGLNFSGKLTYAAVGRAVRNAHLEQDTSLTFETGTVDFTPEHMLMPGAGDKPFPPKVAQPGSVGDADYTPLVRITNAGNHIYNAPVVAFGVDADAITFCDGTVDHSLVHDRVVKICPAGGDNGAGTVTLTMSPIFSFARPTSYISTDASDAVVATLDQGTHAPALADVQVGRDDSFASAVERLFVTVNGPTGADNPQRQGLNSALTDKDANGMPLPPTHVIGGVPTIALDYSPLWDINLGQWTPNAIAKDYRSRMIDEFQYLRMVELGHITGPDGMPFGSTGIVVNCPIVMRFQ